MRKLSRQPRALIATGLAGLIALAFVQAPFGSAYANGGNGKRHVAAPPPTVASLDHQSVVRLTERDGFPIHKVLRLGRNKSMLVELPRHLRDVIVSNPDLMDAVVQSANRVYLIGKKVGQANIFFFDSNGEQIVTFEITIEHDTAILDTMFRRLIPGSAIKTEMLNDTVILTGSVRNPADSSRAADIASRFAVTPTSEANTTFKQRVINLLQVEAEEQVMLRVTVAEVERSVLKQFGINLGAELNIGNFATGILTANNFPLTAGLGSAMKAGTNNTKPHGTGCTLVGDQLQPNVVSSSGPYGFWGSGNNCVAHALKALERDGLIKTLAEPNLTAISGETAKFLAGGEFPVPVGLNNGQLSISFKEFGVGVSFTPLVLSEGRINLKIETEVSELTDAGGLTLNGFGIPGLKKRQAKSTVELPSGGTLALAGLISEDTRKNIDGMPGLKNLPVLGTLFRSQDFIKRETELVVMVTPYTVRPTARQNLARPTDGLAPASDLKSNLFGHMQRVYGKDVPAVAKGSVKDGSVGFIVD